MSLTARLVDTLETLLIAGLLLIIATGLIVAWGLR